MVERRRTLDRRASTRADTARRVTLTCNFLFMCAGYYSYKGGYTPEFPGIERFAGTVVHPQSWPDDLDYARQARRRDRLGGDGDDARAGDGDDRRARHDAAALAHLRRVRPDTDAIANRLRQVLPDKRRLRRSPGGRTSPCSSSSTSARRTKPEKIKASCCSAWSARSSAPTTTSTPTSRRRYNPWDQRLCLVPNGDLFEAIRDGQRIGRHRPHRDLHRDGHRARRPGEELEADIIVTATGLQLVTLGEMDFVVDGEPVDFADTWTYKGFAYSDVPNLASSFGYINASWTLRADLTCEYVCRLLNHMRETGTDQCTPRLRDVRPRHAASGRGSTTSRPATCNG